MNNIPGESIATIASLITAFITAAISFVTLTLSKEQKTSEFRQAWIDGLRTEIASFLAAARSFARAVEVLNIHGPEYKSLTTFRLSDEKVGELRYQAAESLSKIQLRLNPNEVEHQELLRLLNIAIEEQNNMLSNKTNSDNTLKAIQAATSYAQPILKKEWLVVKKGEKSFRIARNWVFPGISILTGISIAYIIFCNS